MIDEIRGNSYYNEPIAFDMDDGDIREVIRPYIMGRIVDVEQFLVSYRCNPNEDGVTISFEITDRFLPWNNKTISIYFQNGSCTITDQQAEFHVKLSISTLTTLLMGYKTAQKLFRMGRIIADESAIIRLDDVLLHEVPYISDYI